MISERSKLSLDAMFHRAAEANLAMDPSHSVVVTPRRGAAAADKPASVYMITIASFHFKLLIFLELSETPFVREYYSKPDAGLGLHDVFPELCNMCAGAMNRELARQYHHLGMSTPNRVEQKCIDHLEALRPVHVSSHRIVIRGSIEIDALLGLCAYAPLDIVLQQPAEESAGVLELL